MANVHAAVEYTLRLEDETLGGAITTIRGDTGGTTRFGLAMRWHPELVRAGFYGPMPTKQALIMASQLLTDEYATPLRIAEIENQRLANVFLAYGVNDGVATAVTAMQRAVNDVLRVPPQLAEDGVMGPQTLSSIDRCMAGSLVNAFRLQVIAGYAARANDNVLRGLIRRALA